MEYKNLLALKREMEKCVRCAACQAGCPTYEISFSETLSARGRIRIARALLSGELKQSPRIAADFEMCLSCLKCAEACPAKIDTVALFQAARADLAAAGGMGIVKKLILRHVLPFPKRLDFMAKLTGLAALFYATAPNALARFLPYSSQGRRRTTPRLLRGNLRGLVQQRHHQGPARGGALRRVAYFSGCMTDLAYPDTGLNVMSQLEKAGVEVVYPQEQVCCGAPAWFAGDNETSRELAEKNVEAFCDLDVDAIVVSCATCGSMLSHALPMIMEGDKRAETLAVKVIDFQKLLVELGAEKEFEKSPGGGKLRVTYHDPCHLKRGMGVSAEPRILIKSLPNVEFVEMAGADVCCGGAGAFTLDHPEQSARFGQFKARAVEESGVDIVVTACPSCQLQLADALARAGLDTPVMSTADLVAMVTSDGAMVDGMHGDSDD
ncbi:MAG: (Fe-S)-binding protein [Nitrospinota bacterium]|nr:(Fe-S)-binding protein [Nitrospinota bacterium]